MHISKIIEYVKNEINFSQEFCEDNVFVTLRIEAILRLIENLEQSHKNILEILKENEELKITVNKQSIDISNNLSELQQKDKQIDLMAEYWNSGLAMCDNCDKIIEKYEKNACKDCIKQYFETKAKKGE